MSGPGSGIEIIILPTIISLILLVLCIIISIILSYKNRIKLSRLFRIISILLLIPTIGGFILFTLWIKTPTTCAEQQLYRFDRSLNYQIKDKSEAFSILKNLELPDNEFFDHDRKYPPTISDLMFRPIKTKEGIIVKAWTLTIWAITEDGNLYKELICQCRGRIYPWRKCTHEEF